MKHGMEAPIGRERRGNALGKWQEFGPLSAPGLLPEPNDRHGVETVHNHTLTVPHARLTGAAPQTFISVNGLRYGSREFGNWLSENGPVITAKCDCPDFAEIQMHDQSGGEPLAPHITESVEQWEAPAIWEREMLRNPRLASEKASRAAAARSTRAPTLYLQVVFSCPCGLLRKAYFHARNSIMLSAARCRAAAQMNIADLVRLAAPLPVTPERRTRRRGK